jgi:NhaA family Na+:H+ antiporter
MPAFVTLSGRSVRLEPLSLAVVDDLVAITIIAVVYTQSLSLAPLALAVIPLALFGILVQRRVRSWWLLLPLAVTTCALVHESGVHATVAGVLLGFLVPVARRSHGLGPGLAEHFEHRWRPVSTGFAVPVFAFFASGVTVVGGGLGAAFTDAVTLGIIVGLVAGKVVGILGATWLVQRVTRAQLSDELSWTDVFGLALLAGIGFTVSLLIGELAFGTGSAADDHVKIGVLSASLLAALLATIVLACLTVSQALSVFSYRYGFVAAVLLAPAAVRWMVRRAGPSSGRYAAESASGSA